MEEELFSQSKKKKSFTALTKYINIKNTQTSSPDRHISGKSPPPDAERELMLLLKRSASSVLVRGPKSVGDKHITEDYSNNVVHNLNFLKNVNVLKK